jgi:hypothetical protein
MCNAIALSVTSLNKRTVWKIFEKKDGKIVSLFMGGVYPKNKLIGRSQGATSYINYEGELRTLAGLYFYLSKAAAKREAATWGDSYIAKFKVSPKDFLHAGSEDPVATYERATRVGNFIKVGYGAV